MNDSICQCMQGVGGPEDPRRLNKWHVGRACKICAGVNGTGLQRIVASVLEPLVTQKQGHEG